jgi:hypothetical protein
VDQQRLRRPFDDVVSVTADAFAVAFTRDNTLLAEQAVFSSEASAREFLGGRVAADATLADAVHVIPAVELAEAVPA